MSRPRRLSIRTRLALIYTGLLAAALVAFGSAMFLILSEQLESSFDARLVANAEHAAGAFAQDIAAGGTLTPAARLIEQFASTGGRVLVLDDTGQQIADSAADGAPLPITPDDMMAARNHAHAIRELVVGGETLRFTVKPVPGPGTTLGYVVWADSTEPLRELLARVGTALLLGGLIVVGLALLGGLVLARRALAPVADLTQTARAIALSGDFAARVESGAPGDEVGELAVAFNEMLDALENNHQALQHFLGDASHQLRTPLTSIRANLELAQRPDVPADERRSILADAREETERMGRLVADLLSLARAEAGTRLEVAPIELDALLLESVRVTRQAAPKITMTVASVEPTIVQGDRDRLRELLGILLDNAARYTPPGGSVAARLHRVDGYAEIRIEDTGIGLADTDRTRLFERLYRGSRARELRPAGTGLGLAIAEWIVRAHQGRLELTDREGGGTVAQVLLPLADRGRPAATVSHAPLSDV